MFLRHKTQAEFHLLDSGLPSRPLSHTLSGSTSDVIPFAEVQSPANSTLKPRDAIRHKQQVLPVSTIRSLTAELRNKHVFCAVDALTADATPFLLMTATTGAGFRSCKKKDLIGAWWWCGDTPFGKVFRFAAGPERPVAEAFLPLPSPVYERFLQTGRIAFALTYTNEISDTYIADFTQDPLWSAAQQLAVTEPPYADFLFEHSDLAYWSLMRLVGTDWGDRVHHRPQDTLHTDWAQASLRQARSFHNWHSQVGPQVVGNPRPALYADHKLAEAHPYFFQLLEAVYAGAAVGILVELAGRSLESADAADDLVRASALAWKWADDLAARIAIGALRLSWLVHPQIRAGRRRPWFNRNGPKIAPDFIELDPSALGYDARNYWRDVDLHWPIDHGEFINGSDLPADAASIRDALSTLPQGGPPAVDLMALAQSLLREAKEHKQWTLPPTGARVELGLSSIPQVDLYEKGSRYWCVLRTLQNRYFLVMVDLADGTLDIQCPDNADESVDENVRAKAALCVIVASIIRDFLVTDQREEIFTQRRVRNKPAETRGAAAKTPGHVFLPRRSLQRVPNIGRTTNEFAAFKPRAKHWVSGHLRSSDSASAEQRLLAQRDGVFLPPGKTYVRPHHRGDAEREQVRRNHRAKSACEMLYPAAEGSAGGRASWFEFERDAYRFAAARKLTVGTVSTPNSRLDALDMLALHRQRDELWLIRFILLPARRFANAVAVRAVVDALYQHQTGTKAVIVTTSGFAPEAVEAARIHNVTLVDGTEFSGRLEKQ